jgi:hypothetical protein
LGASTHARFGGERVSQADRDVLSSIAADHAVISNPDLDLEKSGLAWTDRKKRQAQASGDKKTVESLNDLILGYQDLDN